MLKRIRLKNFRTHKDSELTFCPGVNGIIGISSTGKTNILRALKLLAKNRPIGDGVIYRSAKKKEALIETEWSDVGIIRMVKSKDSYYQINDDEKFRKFGTKVPEQITDALFLSDLNVLGQYDGPFLIFSSPGDISKAINDATGAGEFDTWINNINNRIKTIKFALKDADFRIEKYRVEKEKLKGFARLKRHLKELKKISAKKEKAEFDFERITEIYNRLIGFKSKLAMHEKIIRLQRRVNKIKKLREEMEALEEGVDLYEEWQQKIDSLKALLERHEEFVEKYSKLLAKRRSCPTCKSPIKQSTIKRLKDAVRITQ